MQILGLRDTTDTADLPVGDVPTVQVLGLHHASQTGAVDPPESETDDPTEDVTPDVEDAGPAADTVAAREDEVPTISPKPPRARRFLLLLLAVTTIAQTLTIASREHVAFPTTAPVRIRPPAPIALDAVVRVESQPAGLEIVIDGVSSGITPHTVSVRPGAHILELRGHGLPRVYPVTVAPAARVTHFVELPPLVEGPRDASPTSSPAVPLSGWVRLTAPFELEIYEQDRLVGTTAMERLLMTAGVHTIRLTASALGFDETRAIRVRPGETTTIVLEPPTGVVHLNAVPWAEVWLDGERLGETPLGNLQLPIGPREFVFRHPTQGEKRYAATVALGRPTHVSVDMAR